MLSPEVTPPKIAIIGPPHAPTHPETWNIPASIPVIPEQTMFGIKAAHVYLAAKGIAPSEIPINPRIVALTPSP
jgi:hypothetical protein